MDADDLCSAIEVAFAGVTLDDGIGLWQAQGIDDYECDEKCAEFRRGDEKRNWKLISTETLDRCASSLSFFDAKGFRFHLPAFLIADLTVGTEAEMVSSLVCCFDLGLHRYELLTPAQRSIIREYLLFARVDPDYSFQQPEIDVALATYWSSDTHKPELAEQVIADQRAARRE